MVLIVDGSNMAYRAHCTHTRLFDPSGSPCGAIYGMLQTLRTLVYNSPGVRSVVVTFDTSKSKYRREIYPEYKAHRKTSEEDPMREMYYQQLPNLMKIINLLVPTVTADDIEADDIIAWLAASLGDEKVQISSTDKDMYQLASDRVSIVDAFKKRSQNDSEFEITPKTLPTLIGVNLDQYIDYRALQGDTSDNITGIRGIGKVKAAKLLKQYGSIAGMLEAKVAIVVENQKILERNLKIIRLDLHTKHPELFTKVKEQLNTYFEPDYATFIEVLEALTFRHITENIESWVQPFKLLRIGPIFNQHAREEMGLVHP